MDQKEFLMHPDVKRLLEKFINSLGIENCKITLQPGSAKGENYLGIISEVLVEGKKNGEDVSKHWIAKSAPQIESFRELTHIVKVYERECYMYEVLFPIFTKFQNDRNIEQPFKSFPSFILSHIEPHREVLVMENMKRRGFVLKNRKEALDFEHVKLVLVTYGKFHAVSYALKHQNPDLFETIKKNTEESFFSLMSNEMLMKQEELFCKRSLDSLDPAKNSLYMDVFKKYSERSHKILPHTFRISYQDPHSVICHGDSWVNNMLFKYADRENTAKPTDVCLLDFQLARYGSPAFDLSYFLFTCTEKALRDKHYDELIKIYYQSLCRHLTTLGSVPEDILPFNVLLEQLKRYSIVGFFLTQMVLHLMLSDKDEIPDLTKEMNEQQMVDAFTYKSKNEEFYNRRIRGVIIDFVEKGYFDFVGNEYGD